MATPPVGPPFNYEEALKLAQVRSGTLIETTTHLEGWVKSTNSGIPASMSIYERRTEASQIIVRGEIDGIKAPAYDVAKWIYSLESLPVLDKMAQLENAKIIEEFGDRSSVMYCPYNVPWPLDTRDFVWFQHWESKSSGEEVLSGFSVSRPDVPEKKGHVRGLIYDSGYCIRPTGPDTCRISYIVCIDPMGWVPAWVNTKTAEQAYALAFAKAHFDAHPITAQTSTEAADKAAAASSATENA